MSTTGRRLRVTPASAVQPRRIRWVWDLRVVLGGLTLFAGREGLGKSTIAVDIAAQITRGALDGEWHGTPRTVIYINSEDARDYTIVPRLIAAGADLDRVIFLDGITTADDGEDSETPIVLPYDTELLAEVIVDHDAALVVLDAATSVIDGRLDGNKDREMRQGLERIAKVAERTGAAVLGIVHFGKRESSDTGKLILGSIAWSQVARSVIAVARDDEGDGDLIISATKANLGPCAPSLIARMVSADVVTTEGSTSVGRIVWAGETERNARDLLAAPAPDSEGRTEVDAAEHWLTDYLTMHDKAPSKEVKAAARSAGISERTLTRACSKVRIAITYEGFPRASYWSLPPATSRASDATSRANGGATEETGPDQQEYKINAPVAPHPHVHGAAESRHARGATGATGPDQQEHSRATGATGGATGGGLWLVSGEPLDEGGSSR